MPSLEEAAVRYAELGFYVFPLIPRTKEPATSHGFYDASNVPETVRAWWIKNPDYNIGIAMGHGLVVIDVDEKPEEGKFGLDTLRKWENEHGSFEPTWTVLTGTKGLHYWYKTDKDYVNATEIEGCIDIRSLGAYVAAPPSVHPNGTIYQWEASGDPEDLPIAPLSGSALEFVNQHVETKAKDKPKKKKGTPYKDLKKIKKGGRQTALMSLQGSLKNLNLSDDAIMAAVREENEKKCDPPFTEAELEKEIFPFLRRNIQPDGDYIETVTPAETLDDGVTEDELDLPTLDTIPEEHPEWLEGHYIPKKSITILCGTGGVGKTSIWCSIAAAISRGENSFLTGNTEIRSGILRENRKVIFFSAEDSVGAVLKSKLRDAQADQKNILCLDLADKRFHDVKLSGSYIEKVIKKYRPALCVFDPIQAFIDKRIKMSDRNAMRQEVEPLLRLGQQYDTTFLLVMHTNKQSNVWGRQRMADSADLWDVARSVLMVGDTSNETYGYISQEKNSYAKPADTVIYEKAGGIAVFRGTTNKKDRDYVLEASAIRTGNRESNITDEACDFILSTLSEKEDRRMPVADLDEEMKAFGYTINAIRTAKNKLKSNHQISYQKKGYEGRNYLCIPGKPQV